MTEPELLAVPVDVLATPREGDTYVDRWWIMRPDGVLFWRRRGHRGWSPQCNRDRRAVEHIRNGLYPDAELVHLPIAYLGRWDEDYGHTLYWVDREVVS